MLEGTPRVKKDERVTNGPKSTERTGLMKLLKVALAGVIGAGAAQAGGLDAQAHTNPTGDTGSATSFDSPDFPPIPARVYREDGDSVSPDRKPQTIQPRHSVSPLEAIASDVDLTPPPPLKRGPHPTIPPEALEEFDNLD